MMLHTGLQVNRERVRAILTNYGMLGRAFLANFVLVPIYGVLLVRAFHLSAPIATGVLLMAISPGVPFVVMSGGRQKGGEPGFGGEPRISDACPFGYHRPDHSALDLAGDFRLDDGRRRLARRLSGPALVGRHAYQRP